MQKNKNIIFITLSLLCSLHSYAAENSSLPRIPMQLIPHPPSVKPPEQLRPSTATQEAKTKIESITISSFTMRWIKLLWDTPQTTVPFPCWLATDTHYTNQATGVILLDNSKGFEHNEIQLIPSTVLHATQQGQQEPHQITIRSQIFRDRYNKELVTMAISLEGHIPPSSPLLKTPLGTLISFLQRHPDIDTDTIIQVPGHARTIWYCSKDLRAPQQPVIHCTFKPLATVYSRHILPPVYQNRRSI